MGEEELLMQQSSEKVSTRQMGSPEQRLPIGKVPCQVRWPSPDAAAMLSLVTVWGECGLGGNAASDPEEKLQQLEAVS